MLLDIITCILLAAIPATFSYMLDYALGHPMSDFKPKEIFSGYSYKLALKALPEKKYKALVSGFAPLLNSADPDQRRQGLEQLKIAVVNAGREHFFIEKAIGMCPYCTNFWLALIASLVIACTVPTSYMNPIFYFLLIPIFSHLILRKL